MSLEDVNNVNYKVIFTSITCQSCVIADIIECLAFREYVWPIAGYRKAVYLYNVNKWKTFLGGYGELFF